MKATGPAFERWLVPALYGAQAHRAARLLNRGKAVIAMYHGFTAADAHDGIANHEGKHCHQRTFVDHLAFLQKYHNVVALDDVVRALTTGAPLPDRAAVITIDDGYRSIYTVAYPALKQFQMPASVYLATGFVDDRQFLWTDRVEYAVNHARVDHVEVTIGTVAMRLPLGDLQSRMTADKRLRSAIKALPQDSLEAAVDAVENAAGCSVAHAGGDNDLYEPLTWAETAEMVASGLVSIGSHTHGHVILARCDPERAAREISVSRRIIEDRLGAPCHRFCYPNGRHGDFNAVTKGLLRGQGFSSALTTVYGMNSPGTDVFELRRYNLGKPMMRGELDVRMSGLMDLGSALKGGSGGNW